MEIKLNLNAGVAVATCAAGAVGYFVGSAVWDLSKKIASEALDWGKFCDEWNPSDPSCYVQRDGRYVVIGLYGVITAVAVVKTYQGFRICFDQN